MSTSRCRRPPGAEVAAGLVRLGIEVDAVDHVGADLLGPVVVGRVLDVEEFAPVNGKTIRWCQVDVGAGPRRGIVCGARNFASGDLVVVALPGGGAAGRVRDLRAQDVRRRCPTG